MKTPGFIFVFFATCMGSFAASPEILTIVQREDSIGLYEKFEIALNIKCEFANPFDPDEIDLNGNFTSPSGKSWKINGFYDYSFGMLWKFRFTPNEIGAWQYTVSVRDKNGSASSEVRKFKVYKTTRKGALQLADNKRYLKHASGENFYGVGLWYNDSYAGYGSGRIMSAELDNLKLLGVNFISTYITPLETMASGLGRYDQNICGRLDQLFQMCEERDLILSLNLWFHSYLSETVWGGGNVRWYTNPYVQVTPAKDFYRSETAWKYQEKLYRYFIARWGYSRSLGIWFIVDEVNGTDGWVSGDSLAASTWGKKVHDYFKENDPYNHLTTGTRSGGKKEFWHQGYQVFDLAAREIYEAQGYEINKTSTLDSSKVHPLKSSYMNYAREIKRLWDGYEKPAIIGETGWDHTFYEMQMPGYLAQYHNALWVSLATGTAMTPFWWAHSNRLNDNVITLQIQNIRKFTDHIRFEKLKNIAPAAVTSKKGDAYAIQSDEVIFGWAANPSSDVAGDKISLSSLKNGRYKLKMYHTWRGEFLKEEEINCTNGSVDLAVPFMKLGGSHANYIGQDVAFILQRVPDPTPIATIKEKGKKKN
jgi:Domain of unknown function (DUF5060)